MTTKPNTITAKQASYIEALMVKIAGRDLVDADKFREGLATLSKAAASRMISDLKLAPAMREPSRTAMDAHVRRMDAFRAERKAAASTITVLIVDHLGNQHDQVEVSAADWSPEANTGIHPVPGHSCPDGCCGLQADTATLELHPDGTTTVEGCIC